MFTHFRKSSKSYGCAILFCLFSYATFGQYHFKQLRLTNPDINTLYIGIPNEIDFQSDVPLRGELTFKASSGDLALDNNKMKFEVQLPLLTPALDTISVFLNNQLLFAKVFLVKKIGDPYVRLGYIRDTLATREEVMKHDTVNVVFDSCFYNLYYRITSFQTKIIHAEDVEVISTWGDRLSKAQRKAIRHLESGDKIIFEELKGTCPDCPTRIFKSFSITIK